MPTLQEIIKQFMDTNGVSARALADQLGMSYPTLLSIVNKGSLPRKQEHRERLRQLLAYNENDWAVVLLVSSGLQIDEDDFDPPTFQVLIARTMFARGLTEQSLSKASKVPYPTIANIVRKGVVPKQHLQESLRRALGLTEEAVEEAVRLSRDFSRMSDKHTRSEHTKSKIEDDVIGLAQLVARRIRDAGQTIAEFAKDNGIGYLTLSKFLSTGEPPQKMESLEPLRVALGLTPDLFAKALTQGRNAPAPATVSTRAGEPPPDATPLQVALLRHMREHNLTIKSLSQRSGLSQITVSRLVKQGSPPSRSRTHQQLRELLGISEAEYVELIKPANEDTKPVPVYAPEEFTGDDEFSPTNITDSNIDLEDDEELKNAIQKVTASDREALLKMARKLASE